MNKITSLNIDQPAINRRDFIKIGATSVASVAFLSACKAPVSPLTLFEESNKNNDSKTSWKQTTCDICHENCAIKVKLVNDKPIKIESNPKISGKGICAVGQGSVFNLYSQNRVSKPSISGQTATWEEIDLKVKDKFKEFKGQRCAILSHSISSISTKYVIEQFQSKFENIELFKYDPISYFAHKKANERCFGKWAIPSYHFQKSNIILSFQADFLYNWLSPVDFSSQYSKRKKSGLRDNPLKHYHFESNNSITGSAADKRYEIRVEEEGQILSYLYKYIQAKKSLQTFNEFQVPYQSDIGKIADTLIENEGKSIVISGTENISTQMLVNGINALLGNYKRTIDLDNPTNAFNGDENKFLSFISDLENNKFEGIILYNCDPVNDHPLGKKFKNILPKINFSLAYCSEKNESANACKIVCPDHHFLEKHNIFQPKTTLLQLGQPIVNNLFDSRQFEDSLLKWIGYSGTYLDFLKTNFNDIIDNREISWDKLKNSGSISLKSIKPKDYNFNVYLDAEVNRLLTQKAEKGITLILTESFKNKNGNQLSNPLLSELPEPISQITWTNHVLMSPQTAKNYHLTDGDYISIKNSGFEYPIRKIAGVAQNTLILPLIIEKNKSPFHLIDFESGDYIINVEIEKIRKKPIKTSFEAKTNQRMSNDAIVSYQTYESLKIKQSEEIQGPNMYREKREFKTHHWAMAIDLDLCIGCNSCMISCQIENNIPNVGKIDSEKNRQMYWMTLIPILSDNQFHFLPISCQQCDIAPCEAVCPVSATSNSSEGLNMQNYKKCIGTRFCANNCPYETRKFNYSSFTSNSENNPQFNQVPEIFMLNPEVDIREKGIIEKCNFCFQRIQKEKSEAKKENRPLRDGQIKTACQQTCPTSAIYFGDLNDKSSRVYQLSKDKRAFRLFEELNTQPSVIYLKKIRNDQIV